jgi:hypothetical protein
MSILKYALVGAAVVYGVKYITKKRADGSSILDDLTEKAPEWFEKGKNYAEKTIGDLTDNVQRQARDAMNM